jgi:cell division protein FtsL
MKKRKTSTKLNSSTALWVALLVVFMAELLVYSWCRVQYVHTGYEIAEARLEQQRLRAVHNELKIEEARLRSPERIRRIAHDRGLIVPSAGQVVVVP